MAWLPGPLRACVIDYAPRGTAAVWGFGVRYHRQCRPKCRSVQLVFEAAVFFGAVWNALDRPRAGTERMRTRMARDGVQSAGTCGS